MSLEEYTTQLMKTKTYQAGLIRFQEYAFKSKFYGLSKSLPNVPRADDDRHIVVLQIRGGEPNVLTVLKESEHSIQTTTKDVDKLLFVFVEMRTQTLNIASPEGFRLGDGHRIDAKFSVTYFIHDAKAFWAGSKDQLSHLEMVITDAAKNYFLNLSSYNLINRPAELKQSLEKHVLDTGIGMIKNKLEEIVVNNCAIPGITLQKVISDVNIGDSLHQFLQRIRDKIYEEGGEAERVKIDRMIDNDSTFAPYNLRAVIRALDISLLINFYEMKWNQAMRLVTEKLEEKKNVFLASSERNDVKEVDKGQYLIESAKKLGLDGMDVDKLKIKIAGKLLSLADKETNSQVLSNVDYLKVLIPDSSDFLLESDSDDPKLIEN